MVKKDENEYMFKCVISEVLKNVKMIEMHKVIYSSIFDANDDSVQSDKMISNDSQSVRYQYNDVEFKSQKRLMNSIEKTCREKNK